MGEDIGVVFDGAHIAVGQSECRGMLLDTGKEFLEPRDEFVFTDGKKVGHGDTS